MKKGILLAFEGGDYTTKSTQYGLAVKELKLKYPGKVFGDNIREPGSTDVGETARQILQRFDTLGKERYHSYKYKSCCHIFRKDK